MAPGLGRLKPDTTGSSHGGRPASDFSTFPFISNIIYIPSLGVKVQSDAHYSSKKIISLYLQLVLNPNFEGTYLRINIMNLYLMRLKVKIGRLISV